MLMPLCHPLSLTISKTSVFISPIPHQSFSLGLEDVQHSAADTSKYQRRLYKQAMVKSSISKRYDLQICTSSQHKAEGSSNTGTSVQWKAWIYLLAGRYVNLHLSIYWQPLGMAPFTETFWTALTSLQQAQILPFAWLKPLDRFCMHSEAHPILRENEAICLTKINK